MTQIDVPQLAGPAIAALVEAEVERRWPAQASGVEAMARYGLVPFGQTLGPMLLIRSALAVGGRVEQVLPAAIAVECLQVGAMMHDDIIDGDRQRYGKPATHTVFGAPSAIVGGDALFFSGIQALSECCDAGVPAERVAQSLTVLAQTGRRIADAVATEIRLGRSICSTKTYLEMIRDKGGSLLWLACGLGSILSGADEASVRSLGQYSDLLGIAYQIRDDLMAYDGTQAGKPSVSDMRNGRPTLPVLLAHRRASRSQRRLIEHLLADTVRPVEERHEAMAGVIASTGALNTARSISHRYARIAGDALSGLPVSEHRDALHGLTTPGLLV
ncbi:polyprenyl synthetase family protein [Streptomyces sp. NPDC050738]|uniref:polyprenyl synthetase family protein n=1 Tax=Streptomyces sp. NPDC050738 TaxID=3154744 RepID=UPI00342F3C81